MPRVSRSRTSPRKRSRLPTGRPAYRLSVFPSTLWAIATVGIFPIVLVVMSSFGGVTSFTAFVSGMAASLLILIVNVLVEKRVWMSDEPWRSRFEEPEFAMRLAFVSGIILFLIETTLLLIFFTDGAFDLALLRLVFSRQCGHASVGFGAICQALLQTYGSVR